MKVSIEFTLPEEQDDLNLHNKRHNLYCALEELSQELRKLYKYGDERKVSISFLRQRFHEILSDNDLEDF